MILCDTVTDKRTIQCFINLENRFIKLHNNKYDYSKSVYVNSRTNLEIKCKNCKNIFYMTSNNHLKHIGCYYCNILEKIDHNKNEFIRKSNEIYNNKYDYSKVIYKDTTNIVKIICGEHGIFEQTPKNHLYGIGCLKCKNIQNPTVDFINKANLKHINLYDYKNVKYINSYSKVEILCNFHNKYFYQTPNNHLNGQGCPYCARELNDIYNINKYKNIKSILYYVKINDYFKIGITKKTVLKRFKNDIAKGINIEILFQLPFDDGLDAFKIEQAILKDSFHLSITKNESPITGGWTEMRKKCIMNYINKYIHI